MGVLKDIIVLLTGFVLLVKGADLFVDGSVAVAKILKIPNIIVGLTIVAMGTSLPELAVSVTAGINGSNEIAISNVVGSNIFNLIVVLGACALMSPVLIDKSVLKREFPFSIIVTAVVALMMADNYISVIPKVVLDAVKNCVGVLSRFNGVILIILFCGFMAYSVTSALNQRKNLQNPEEEDKPKFGVLSAILCIAAGIIAIKFGGDFVVDSASNIARVLGMSETLVGLTIVAIGTSLPELVTSVVAAKKKETALAIGNVIGSNIFNVLLILGASSTISPIAVGMISLMDTLILILISIIVFVFAKTKNTIGKKEGIVMLMIYAVYMAYAIIR